MYWIDGFWVDGFWVDDYWLGEGSSNIVVPGKVSIATSCVSAVSTAKVCVSAVAIATVIPYAPPDAGWLANTTQILANTTAKNANQTNWEETP